MLKQVLFFLFFFIGPVLLCAQRPDSTAVLKDSLVNIDSTSVRLADSVIIVSPDTAKKDSILQPAASYRLALEAILKENLFLHTSGKPVAMANRVKLRSLQENYFYLIAAIAGLLGLLRFFYTMYFSNLFRVFFNASLRQSQLTDQLLQAKLPALFFNMIFVLAGGMYIYLLLRYFNWISGNNFWQVLFYCTLSLGLIYFVKMITLKFTGWLTGYQEVTNTYVFILFLINKILSVIWIPFTIIIAFASPALSAAAVIISLLVTALLFILRFFRSYGLLQHQLKISRIHFFMYVAGIEILPVLLIYKGLVLLLSKNL